MADEPQIPANESNPGIGNQEDDSDWEYEYHETETETFYVTVDTSSFTSNIRTKQNVKPSNLTPEGFAPQPGTEPNKAKSSHPHGPPSNPSDAIQILDLHSSNPLISHQSRLYSCAWSTTLGTDLLLSSLPSSNSPFLAATRIKLSARPVRLIPHHGVPKHSKPSRNQEQTQNAVAKSSSTKQGSPTFTQLPVSKIPIETHATLARQNQAHFLERLIAAKAAKGEKDSVAIYAKKRFMGTGWRARQRFHELMEMEVEDEAKNEEGGEDASVDGRTNRNGNEDHDEESDEEEDNGDENEDEDEDENDDEDSRDDDDDDEDDENNDDNDSDSDDGDGTAIETEPEHITPISMTAPTQTFGTPVRTGRIGRPKGSRSKIEGGGLFRDYRPLRKAPNEEGLFRNYGPSAGSSSAAFVPAPGTRDQLAPDSEKVVLSAAPNESGDVIMEDG